MGATQLLQNFKRMKVFPLIFIVGLTKAGLVRREADADPKAGVYGSASQPICRSVPEKTCTPRNVEKPRKVCHDEYDKIVDTTITEHCEEIITTKCEQVSTHARHSSGVVGTDSKIVATGVLASPERTVSYGRISSGIGASYGSYGGASYGSYGKREAKAVAEAEPKADAEGANYGYSAGHTKSAPVCTSVPQKMCKNVPIETPRKVKKTLCKTVVDIDIIEDCKEVITTHCEQTSQKVAHHSSVVGHDSRVGPIEVVGSSSYGAVSSGYGSSVGGITRFGGYGRY